MGKNEKSGQVTLKDVAEKSGYSVNTVSRVLRNKDDIAENTKNTIKQIAEEMGYINNMMASSLRLGYTKTIAVILGDVSNPHFSIMTKEIEEQSRKFGYSCFLINTNEDDDLELKAINDAINKNVDGIIICPVQKSTNNIEFLKKRNVPFVLLGRHFDEIDTDYVICDDKLGGYLATKYLIDMGHRDILFINAPLYISSARERLEGYYKALDEAGIEKNIDLVHIMDDVKNISDFDEIFNGKRIFTGIFSFNDVMAWSTWKFVQEKGFEIPKDYSIIGFDHIQSKMNIPFKLTSISSYKTKMSILAVDILVEKMQSKEKIEMRHMIIKTELVEGCTVKKIM